MRARYSRWDGTQDPLGPDLAAAELLEEMSEDILSGAGAEGALSRLLRRGMSGRFTGLDALRARLRQAARRERERLNLDGPLQEIERRLAEILEDERRTLSLHLEDDARMREQSLDMLPQDPAGKLRELQDYRFVDKEAQRKFDELMQWVREQVMASYFRNMAQGLQSMSAEDLAAFKDMLGELNELIGKRERGELEPGDFQRFMEKHGRFFPENPQSLEELLEQMGRRMAAMSRLLASMSPEQRAELRALSEQILQDMDLAFQVSQLAQSLADLFPQMPW